MGRLLVVVSRACEVAWGHGALGGSDKAEAGEFYDALAVGSMILVDGRRQKGDQTSNHLYVSISAGTRNVEVSHFCKGTPDNKCQGGTD